jgi:prepilin-type N-terminal cleavage/methylation domain-containing protein
MIKENNFRQCFARRSRTDGFTLVETMVAVSLFSLAVVALLVSLGAGISDTGYAKRKMSAEYLAQEGVEYLRNVRDTFMLYGDAQTGWVSFNGKLSAASCHTAAGCYFGDLSPGNFTDLSFQITSLPLTACSSESGCPMLLYNSATGKFNYASGDESGFIRRIQSEVISDDETRIFSTVFWAQGSGTYSVTFSANLFNWIE